MSKSAAATKRTRNTNDDAKRTRNTNDEEGPNKKKNRVNISTDDDSKVKGKRKRKGKGKCKCKGELISARNQYQYERKYTCKVECKWFTFIYITLQFCSHVRVTFHTKWRINQKL